MDQLSQLADLLEGDTEFVQLTAGDVVDDAILEDDWAFTVLPSFPDVFWYTFDDVHELGGLNHFEVSLFGDGRHDIIL